MKNVTILLLFFSLTVHCTAQGVFSNQTSNALQKVIQDFPNQFRNIKGDLVTEYARGTDYRSKVQIPGAITCVVTENGANREAFSWRSELFQASDFNVAKKKFSELYNQIHNTIIKIEGEKPVILNGRYDMPDGSKKEYNIVFQVLPATPHMRRLKVELLLQEVGDGWKITLCVNDHHGDTDLVAEQ